jgi:hypothetical protein
MISPSLGRKFKAPNLLGAIFLLLFGAAGLAQPLYAHAIRIDFFLAAIGGVLGGFYVLFFNTWIVSCKRCNAFLVEYELHFGSDSDCQALQNALQHRVTEHLIHILDQAPIPPMAQPGQSRYALALEMCTTCKKTARLSLTHLTFDANANVSNRKELVKWTELSSPLVPTLFDRMVARNERATAQAYGAVYTA